MASRQISVFSIQTPDFRVLSADGGVVRRGDPVGVVAKISSNLHQISITLWYDAFYDNGRTALAHGSMIARSSISKEGGGGSSAWRRLRSHHLFFQARGERAGGARLSLVLRNPLEEGPAAGCRAHGCDLFARWWYNQYTALARSGQIRGISAGSGDPAGADCGLLVISQAVRLSAGLAGRQTAGGCGKNLVRECSGSEG